MFEREPCRVKLFWFSEMELLRFLRAKQSNEVEVVVAEGIPDGANVLRVFHEPMSARFGVLIEHSSFDPVPDGEMPTAGERIMFRYVKAEVVADMFAFNYEMTVEQLTALKVAVDAMLADLLAPMLVAGQKRHGDPGEWSEDVPVIRLVADPGSDGKVHNTVTLPKSAWIGDPTAFEKAWDQLSFGPQAFEARKLDCIGVDLAQDSDRMGEALIIHEGITDARKLDCVADLTRPVHLRHGDGYKFVCGHPWSELTEQSTLSQKVTCLKCREML